jgi:hypothetical protein
MWLLEELKSELEFMKQVAHKRIRKIKRKEIIMSDSDYQAGVTAAIVAYQATVTYPVTGFSYIYTPPATATPPAETVSVSF